MGPPREVEKPEEEKAEGKREAAKKPSYLATPEHTA